MNGCTTVLLRLLLHRSTGHGRPLMRRRRARRLDARMYLQIYRLVDGSATSVVRTLTSENISVSSSFFHGQDLGCRQCAACSPGGHSVPSSSEPPSGTVRSNGLGTSSKICGCCFLPAHSKNEAAFSFQNVPKITWHV
jgi:hypothetical protein